MDLIAFLVSLATGNNKEQECRTMRKSIYGKEDNAAVYDNEDEDFEAIDNYELVDSGDNKNTIGKGIVKFKKYPNLSLDFVENEPAVNNLIKSHFTPHIFLWQGGKRGDESPDGKRSAPPMDTRNTRGVTAFIIVIISQKTSTTTISNLHGLHPTANPNSTNGGAPTGVVTKKSSTNGIEETM
uniref:SFRICE_032393 n=1 Tax=Spodoptera frugiperda TaxID=7108 RepID=A0A2H1VN53_SPOFR